MTLSALMLLLEQMEKEGRADPSFTVLVSTGAKEKEVIACHAWSRDEQVILEVR